MGTKPISALRSAAKQAICVQIPFGILLLVAHDREMPLAAFYAIGYDWLWIAWVRMVRSQNATAVDLTFIRWGCPILFFTILILGAWLFSPT